MTLLALGQSKMIDKPISGILHVIVYIGFVIINIELLEIVVDGLFGTHRVFAYYMGGFYDFLIASFEILAFLVVIAVIIFWTRRNIMKIKRFLNPEMIGWPKKDADFILYFEIVLMFLFLSMNAVDGILQELNTPNYIKAARVTEPIVNPFKDTLAPGTSPSISENVVYNVICFCKKDLPFKKLKPKTKKQIPVKINRKVFNSLDKIFMV